MKYLACLLLLTLSSSMENKKFIKEVISNFDRYSYFVSMEVESPEYKGKVIIENKDLYNYYNQTQNIDKKKYQETMYRLLKTKSTLKIKKEDFKKFNFLIIYNDTAIISNTRMGVDSFIKTYFNGRVLKDNITDKERNIIISKLYDFNIVSKIDDETGYLVIY